MLLKERGTFSNLLILGERFKELLVLLFPISLMYFSNYLFFIVEKVFLARYSIQAMEAAVSATYACQIAQVTCIAITLMSQIYVAELNGAQKPMAVGPSVWQFIWFSFLSMLITLPFSFFYGIFYFKDSSIETIVWPYYWMLVLSNFLFPLATTLSCYFLGLGKMSFVLLATIGSQAIKIGCAYLFIFGWEDFFPPFGLMGGALSTIISQVGLCLLLFGSFLNFKNAKTYNTRNWKLRPKLFWNYVQSSFSRAIGRVMALLSWTSITHLMSAKGGDYLLVLSTGGTIMLFLPFLSEALCRAQVTLIANILGAKKYHLITPSFYSAIVFVLIIILLLFFPLIAFPSMTYHYFFPEAELSEEAIQTVFFGVWASFAFFIFSHVPISHILVLKDTKFFSFMGTFSWVNGYLLIYVAIKLFDMPAEQFWLVLALMQGSTALLYYFRMQQLESQIFQEKILM